MKRAVIGAVAFFMLVSASSAEVAVPAARASETARLLAGMLVSGRAVVAYYQKTINDPALGNKGFTGTLFEKRASKDFDQTMKVDMNKLDPEIRKLLVDFMASMRHTVDTHQDIINTKGVAFKGFIPAYFGRISSEDFANKTGIIIKQTTFTPRNAKNAPDDFERSLLQKFGDGVLPDHKGYGEQVGSNYRYMFPVYIQENCLQCHGDPKGQPDVTGTPKEGYKRWSFRGGISVSFKIQM